MRPLRRGHLRRAADSAGPDRDFLRHHLTAGRGSAFPRPDTSGRSVLGHGGDLNRAGSHPAPSCEPPRTGTPPRNRSMQGGILPSRLLIIGSVLLALGLFTPVVAAILFVAGGGMGVARSGERV